MRRLRFLLLAAACLPISAQQHAMRNIRVDKKLGQFTGPALVTAGSKVKLITQHIFQAWPINNGDNVLLLVATANKSAKNCYLLRFVEGATRKRRDLGRVPFSSAKLSEGKQEDGSSLFVLSGATEGRPAIVITDITGVHEQLSSDEPLYF